MIQPYKPQFSRIKRKKSIHFTHQTPIHSNMTTSTMTWPVNIVLDQRSDWDFWIETIRGIASGEDRHAWEYINPNNTTQLMRQKPIRPTFKDINPTVSSRSELSPAELELLNIQLMDYVLGFILTSVSLRHRICLRDKDPVYDMLVALKKRLAPTDHTRKPEVSAEYAELKTLSI